VDSILMMSSYTCSSHRSVLSRCTDTSNHNNIVLKTVWLLLLRALAIAAKSSGYCC